MPDGGEGIRPEGVFCHFAKGKVSSQITHRHDVHVFIQENGLVAGNIPVGCLQAGCCWMPIMDKDGHHLDSSMVTIAIDALCVDRDLTSRRLTFLSTDYPDLHRFNPVF